MNKCQGTKIKKVLFFYIAFSLIGSFGLLQYGYADTASKGMLGGQISAEFGGGPMQSSQGGFASRTMDSLNLLGFLGLRLGSLVLGPFFQYEIVGQLTDPNTVGNSNMKGKAGDLGPGIRIELGSLFLFVGAGVWGWYNFDIKSTSSQTVQYSSPMDYKFMAGFAVSHQYFLTVGADLASYGNISVDGGTAASTSDKLEQQSYRAGLTFLF